MCWFPLCLALAEDFPPTNNACYKTFAAVTSPLDSNGQPCRFKSFRLSLLFSEDKMGLEPIAEELSGGQFLTPVQTLVATFIKMYIKSCCLYEKARPQRGLAFLTFPTDKPLKA